MHPDDGHHAGRNERLHDGGEDVLVAGEAAVEEAEARRHEEHQRRCGEHPRGIAAIDHVGVPFRELAAGRADGATPVSSGRVLSPAGRARGPSEFPPPVGGVLPGKEPPLTGRYGGMVSLEFPRGFRGALRACYGHVSWRGTSAARGTRVRHETRVCRAFRTAAVSLRRESLPGAAPFSVRPRGRAGGRPAAGSGRASPSRCGGSSRAPRGASAAGSGAPRGCP